jgi:hypothetical protein
MRTTSLAHTALNAPQMPVRPKLNQPAFQRERLVGSRVKGVYGKTPNTSPLSGGTTSMYLLTGQGIHVIAPSVGLDH